MLRERTLASPGGFGEGVVGPFFDRSTCPDKLVPLLLPIRRTRRQRARVPGRPIEGYDRRGNPGEGGE